MNSTEILMDAFRDLLRAIVREVYEETRQAIADEKKKHRRFYTRQEVCDILHIGTTTFYRLANKGKITILKIEGKTLVDADDFDHLVETRQVFRYQH